MMQYPVVRELGWGIRGVQAVLEILSINLHKACFDNMGNQKCVQSTSISGKVSDFSFTCRGSWSCVCVCVCVHRYTHVYKHMYVCVCVCVYNLFKQCINIVGEEKGV